MMSEELQTTRKEMMRIATIVENLAIMQRIAETHHQNRPLIDIRKMKSWLLGYVCCLFLFFPNFFDYDKKGETKLALRVCLLKDIVKNWL